MSGTYEVIQHQIDERHMHHKNYEILKSKEEKKPKHSIPNENRKSKESFDLSKNIVVKSPLYISIRTSKEIEILHKKQSNDINKNSQESKNKIFEELNKLMEKKYCNNFVHLWGTERLGPTLRDIDQSIKDYLIVRRLKEIMFQVFWGLMIAQKELKFIHNCLYSSHIQVSRTDRYSYYYLKDSIYPEEERVWRCEMYEVKIFEYSKAQIECNENGEIKKYGENVIEFDESVDRKQLALIFEKFDIPDYSKQGIYDKQQFEEVMNKLTRKCQDNQNMRNLIEMEFFNSLLIDKDRIGDKDSLYTYEYIEDETDEEILQRFSRFGNFRGFKK